MGTRDPLNKFVKKISSGPQWEEERFEVWKKWDMRKAGYSYERRLMGD